MLDLVELCGPASTTTTSHGPPCGAFRAHVATQVCSDIQVEATSAEGFAGVACHHHYCFSALAPRNRSWQIYEQRVAQCLPTAATYYHARRICEVFGAQLPTLAPRSIT